LPGIWGLPLRCCATGGMLVIRGMRDQCGARIRRRRYPARDAARHGLFAHTEGYYKRQRLHSALGYITPEQSPAPSRLIQCPLNRRKVTTLRWGNTYHVSRPGARSSRTSTSTSFARMTRRCCPMFVPIWLFVTAFTNAFSICGG
jgi:hypothetical protein